MPSTGKKRKSPSEDDTPPEADSESTTTEETAKSRRKALLKKKKQKQKEKKRARVSDMDEDARKELQRKRQAEARLRQAKGELTKKERKRRQVAGEHMPRTPKAKKLRREALERTKGKGKEDDQRPDHDMVIIPIFWKQHPGEEEAIVSEATRVKKMLARHGLDVWVDRTHKLTPGQKLAFWEGQGVRWRIELGPKDLAKKNCVLSLTGIPGEYDSVKKLPKVSSVKCGQLLYKLKEKLGMSKISQASIDKSYEQP